MAESIIVSFCIPTYNKKDMVTELVLNILSCANSHFEIIVMDNCSTDETVTALQSIKDPRLHVFEHTQPVPPCRSWYDTLDKGNGQWIFHVNDRDWIDATYIDLLIETLSELDKKNVGFAVAGERLSQTQIAELYDEGQKALNEFALHSSHPTGQIIRKQDWDSIQSREQYFNTEQYGIYPHGYLYAILGNRKKGAYLLFDICDKAHYYQRLVQTTSTFYASQTNKKEWFLPESRYELLIYAVENVHLIENPTHIKPFILSKYISFFYAATIEWHANCQNEILKMRYNRPDLETNYLSLMALGFDYITAFREYLANQDFAWADNEFYASLRHFDEQLLKWLLEWTDELRKKE